MFIRGDASRCQSCFCERGITDEAILNLHGLKGVIVDQLLSIPQFAKLLNVTVSCIRRWILARRINVVKVGRLVRIPRTEFDRIITEGTRAARQTAQGETWPK